VALFVLEKFFIGKKGGIVVAESFGTCRQNQGARIKRPEGA
jgi:hypothetical protein